MGKITDTQLLADIHAATVAPRDQNFVDTHADSRGLRKQGISGENAPYVSVK